MCCNKFYRKQTENKTPQLINHQPHGALSTQNITRHFNSFVESFSVSLLQLIKHVFETLWFVYPDISPG